MRDRTVDRLRQFDVLARIGDLRLPQSRVTRVRKDLIDTPAGHNITAQEHRQQLAAHTRTNTRSGRCNTISWPSGRPARLCWRPLLIGVDAELTTALALAISCPVRYRGVDWIPPRTGTTGYASGIGIDITQQGTDRVG